MTAENETLRSTKNIAKKILFWVTINIEGAIFLYLLALIFCYFVIRDCC